MNQLKVLFSFLLASLITFYAPLNGLIIPVLWLIGFDILTGLYVAKRIDKVPITSRQFFRKLPQVLTFMIAMSAAMHADPFFVQFGLGQFQSAKFVISFYGIYELFSILENLGKSGLPIAKQLTSMLREKLPEDIQKTLEEPK